MTPISRIEPQKASAEAVTERHDSGIRALASVARHQGLDWSLTRLNHVYGADHEPDARAMVRMARAEGLKAAVQKMDWKKLSKLQKQAPFLVRLNSGAWFVVLKVGADAQGEGEKGEQVVVFNPKVPQANLFPVERDKFLTYWTGEVVFLKRVYKAEGGPKKFGLSWCG